MQAVIEAIVIRGGVPRRPHLSDALAATGWSVRDCAAIGRLGELAEARAPQVLVLEGPAHALCTLTGIARFTVPRAAVIVLADDAEVESRIVALAAGADATCSLHVEVRELAALGRAQALLRSGESPSEASRWCLASGGRVLAGPRGQRLPLTFTESAFFRRLLAAPGYRLPRAQLLASPSGPNQARSARSVDVMVSRLRAKAQRLGVELPLLAVRQWGYIFLADNPTGNVDASAIAHAPGQPGA
ncbi:response regulator transcription factor [Bordetella petrii]|uniref:response regulator transcription factor n=1 Tax=Bordetella petrii TaxID=94624 RepID=UPI001A95D0E3|nr:winged helix-turn-helix domain-containing protein [Bordetella petrii]MBO1112271.1 response regulator transcription factor [Bordetella petrii]